MCKKNEKMKYAASVFLKNNNNNNVTLKKKM